MTLAPSNTKLMEALPEPVFIFEAVGLTLTLMNPAAAMLLTGKLMIVKKAELLPQYLI